MSQSLFDVKKFECFWAEGRGADLVAQIETLKGRRVAIKNNLEELQKEIDNIDSSIVSLSGQLMGSKMLIEEMNKWEDK